ncbi:MAG TPA: DUF1697 domain-containing protein [Oligoflexia bacterium]|nr:DUF1697 domain-containing protein [Oligoflexia bacterium]HMR24280.1 DUF1697 domain-containing protein [Oligoflexia bacterium]
MALLRGTNVSGHNKLPMASLSQVLDFLSCANI